MSDNTVRVQLPFGMPRGAGKYVKDVKAHMDGLEAEIYTLRSTVQWLRRENDTLRAALDRVNNIKPSTKHKRKGKAK